MFTWGPRTFVEQKSHSDLRVGFPIDDVQVQVCSQFNVDIVVFSTLCIFTNHDHPVILSSIHPRNDLRTNNCTTFDNASTAKDHTHGQANSLIVGSKGMSRKQTVCLVVASSQQPIRIVICCKPMTSRIGLPETTCKQTHS